MVVSSSANTADVLAVTGLDEYVEDRVDGVTIKNTGMPGKPAPDSFLAGAQARRCRPVARGGVRGRDGRASRPGGAANFGFVVGVNRLDDDHAAALHEHGADVVVRDLGELL